MVAKAGTTNWLSKLGVVPSSWPYRVIARRCFLLAAPLLVLASFCMRSPLQIHAAESGTVTFSQDFPGSDPERYSISVASDGSAHYECSGKVSQDSEDSDTYESSFKFSDASRDRIFNLAAQANYFSGKIDSGNRKLAFSGAKKLSYKDGTRNFIADYNYSSLSPVQQLTALFQSIGATLEFGRRLTYYHRYQKLALDEELKSMETQIREGSLTELQSVKAILQEIYEDPSVINIVRARAQKIMEMGSGAGAGR